MAQEIGAGVRDRRIEFRRRALPCLRLERLHAPSRGAGAEGHRQTPSPLWHRKSQAFQRAMTTLGGIPVGPWEHQETHLRKHPAAARAGTYLL